MVFQQKIPFCTVTGEMAWLVASHSKWARMGSRRMWSRWARCKQPKALVRKSSPSHNTLCDLMMNTYFINTWLHYVNFRLMHRYDLTESYHETSEAAALRIWAIKNIRPRGSTKTNLELTLKQFTTSDQWCGQREQKEPGWPWRGSSGKGKKCKAWQRSKKDKWWPVNWRQR